MPACPVVGSRAGLSRSGAPRVLLVCPAATHEPPDSCAFAESFKGAAVKSVGLAEEYAAQAAALGVECLDANACTCIPDPVLFGGDGIHLSVDNCADIGTMVAAKVKDMFATRILLNLPGHSH